MTDALAWRISVLPLELNRAFATRQHHQHNHITIFGTTNTNPLQTIIANVTMSASNSSPAPSLIGDDVRAELAYLFSSWSFRESAIWAAVRYELADRLEEVAEGPQITAAQEAVVDSTWEVLTGAVEWQEDCAVSAVWAYMEYRRFFALHCKKNLPSGSISVRLD